MEPVGTVVDVGEGDFQARVLDASRTAPVVVDFWAGWCRPCLVLGPVLERLVAEHGQRLVLAKVDVDASPTLAARYGVRGIPAVKAFVDGDVVSEFVGVQPEDAVRRFLEGLLPTEGEELAAAARTAEERGDRHEAERGYRHALSVEPGNRSATVGLARLLAVDDGMEEAAKLLRSLPPDAEVRSLLARAELGEAASAGDGVATAARDAIAGRHREALERCLGLVRGGGDERDRAREIMLRVFDELGDDHPLTREFRPRLASALF